MNYGGNMPDWHQYNASQTNEVTPPTQNVNSGHLAFIPGVSPPTLNAISLGSDGLNKHQSDANYNARNYQSYNNVSNGPNISNNNPLASMVQMQNCIGHYGSPNTRNPMLDNINASVDPRNTTIGTINDEIGYRNNQVPFNGPIGHLSGPSCNLNASSGPGAGPGSVPGPRTNSGPGLGTNPGSGTGPGPMYGSGPRHGPALGHGSGSGPGNMGPRNTNIGSVPPSGKPGPPPSFIPCKGLCCNSDPNVNYQQWEKYGSYQNNTSYRDNVHPSNYQMENRHYGNNCNFRKDNLESKEVMGPVLPNASTVDHRRNFADYKYHKDHLVHRNYSTSTGMYHNYPMQGYNYSAEHQKYAYPVKEHAKTNNMNIPNTGMLKHQEQNFIAQQKYNNKQFQYQNGNMLQKSVPTLNVNANMASSPQNPYFNSQFPRNIPAEMSHECQETTDNTAMVNRMQGTFMHSSPQQHQVYQHKIAMQKFSMENHLRELSRIPGYQTHPKYKECVLRYREVLKLQQSSGYPNQVQQASRVATPVNPSVPPINLQFDQNGMLINSSYLPDSFPKLQHAPAVQQAAESMNKQNKDQTVSMGSEKCQQSQQPEQLMIPQQSEHVPSSCAETFQKQNQFSIHKDFNQNQLKVQTNESHSFDTLNTNTSNETMMQQKASKEFANKPDLDVRQFLANWDETDDEEGTSNLPDTILSETTPVVVVSYENVDLSSKTPQGTEAPRRGSFCSNETLEDGKEDEANVIAAQGLTISYSSPDNSEIAKTSKRTIGEGVVKPGSIIHCISNGPDEIPTIHIVDNLEISNILGASNGQVIQTLEKQKTISFFRESSNNETEVMALENAEQQDKGGTRILPANYGAPLDDVNKNGSMEGSSISETIQTTTVSMNNQELRTLSGAGKNNQEVSDNMELKKQHSFEESHNPDDISLPDLPTSECTPISTTLNTPIHSDSEESSQNIEDLSISANPIEVMQNSPVISFTQMNSGEKEKNRSLGTLELEFQKESRYKSNEANGGHEQEVTLGNFDFSSNSKAKNETNKHKQVKNFGSNAARKKVYLIDGKESDSRVSDTCGVLTSMEYELEVQHETVEGEKSSDRGSSSSTHEGRHKSIRRSTETMRPAIQNSDSIDNIGSNANLSPTESDDESQASKNERDLFRRKKRKTLTVSTNPSCATFTEIDLNARKRAKKTGTWEDKCIDKYIDRNLTQKRDADHSRQSKDSDARKFDDSSSSHGGEHAVCHMTSQYKHYSVAVIKDNVTLSDKRSHGTTDRITSEKSTEFQSRMNNNNTKDLSEEAEARKHTSTKSVSTLHDSVQSQTSRLLQKDLKTVDGDVRYTAEEIRLLKEYRRKKNKLHQAHETHKDDNRDEKVKSRSHSLKTVDKEPKVHENSFYHRNKLECLQIRQSKEVLAANKMCLEQHSVSSVVNLNSENSEAQEEAKGQSYSKSMVKNTDFGIQVANVNLKIKDTDVGKELILGDKGKEHVKDSLEGIKIEINVSCTDRNSKGQEQNKRLLYDDRSLYEIDDSLSYSNTLDCQRRLHTKDLVNNSKLPEKAHRASEKSDVAAVDAIKTNQTKSDAEINLSTTLKKSGRASLVASEESSSIVSKETCSLTSDSQSFGKSLCNNVSSKSTQKMEAIEATNYATDHVDIIKSKSAIPNTAIVDANNKVKGKNKCEGDKEDNRMEDDRAVRIQKQGSTSVVDVSNVTEKEIASVAHSRSSKKLPESSLVELSARSLNNLSNLDFNFDKLEYKKCSVVNSDRGHRLVEELDEEGYSSKWKKPKIDIFEDCDMFQSSSGYVNPIFSSIDKLEDLHTVPVYTTKDGKISYSPNRRFTYHELMMEARKREASSSARKSHYVDTWNNYYNSKFRKLYKKKRHHGLNDRKKFEYKDTKYLYDRKRNYSDEFCSKSNVKYKEYVHSIKNNNAVWSDHCKMDKMYSSSDSDEEIIDRTKNCVAEATSCKNQAAESRTVTVSKSHKSEIVNELDLECKTKEDNPDDDQLDKGKEFNSEETSLVQPQILNTDKDNEDCENINNNCKDNLISDVQSDVPSTLLESNREKENVDNVDKIESLTLDNLELTPENLQINENKSLNNECMDVATDRVESKIILENEGNVGSKDESSISELLNQRSLLDENTQVSGSCSLEDKQDNEKIIFKETDVKEQTEESDTKVPDSQTSSMEAENNSEDVKHIKTTTNLEADEINVPESEAETITEVSKLEINYTNIIEKASEESLEPETSNNTSNEIVKESEINISQDNILELEEENIQFSEEVEVTNEDETYLKNVSKEIENNAELLEHRNDDNLLKDAFPRDEEKSESQMVQEDVTIDQENNSEQIFFETIEHEDDINTNFDQVDNIVADEQDFSGFSKAKSPIEVENISENVVVSNKDEMEAVLTNIEETLVETEIVSDNLKNENGLDNFPSVFEYEKNPSRDTSVEKEMPVLNMYCTIKNSSIMDAESSKEAENDKQKEQQRHSLEQVPCKSSTNSSDSNTDVKAIPKLVIKKTDALNSKSECSLDYTDSSESHNKYDAKLLSEARPKIPKMIIMKSRSRSVTPTIELLEKNKSDKTQTLSVEQNDESMDVDNSDSESYILKYNNYENKIPKVKIKLEDISTKDLKLYLKRKAVKKNVPKVKIKKLKTQESKKFETEDSSGTEATDSDEEDNFQESMTSDTEVERIPKLKLKRHEESESLSPERNRRKESNVSKVPSKRIRKTKEEDSRHSTKYDTTAIDDELKKKFPRCIIEKIPKVIIKRTQIGKEFKCEISRSKKTLAAETSKWQPQVKLQRLEILDHMVKGLKQSKITLKDKFDLPIRAKDDINDISKEDPINDSKVKLSRSNSASSLSPVKCKQRRLSDSGYMKMDSKSAIEFDNNLCDTATSFKSDNNEIRNIKRKEKRKMFSLNSQENCDQNDDSEDESKETETEHFFGNILINEDNNMMVVKKEYSYFGTKESTPLAENKFLNSAMRSRNYEDNDNSIIKVDSSDESQTTIEILPASPDSSEDEAKNTEFENTNDVNIEGAIPTQLELELELIDNNNMRSAVLASKIDCASHSQSKYATEGSTKAYFSEFQNTSRNIFGQNSMESQESRNSETKSNGYFYCNDLLVKEVLAAKETLKKCLTRPKNEDAERRNSRTRTVAEKKQGLSFNLKKSVGKSEEACSNSDNDKAKASRKSRSSEKKGYKSPSKLDTEKSEETCSKREEIYSMECPTASTCGDSSVPEPTTISLKASKKCGQATMNGASTDMFDLPNRQSNDSEESQEEKFEKKTSSNVKGQKDNGSSNETKTKEDNMPLLVPEFALNFESSSDRDSSRSPPVITNQEEVEQVVEDAKVVENKVISQTEEVEEDKKHSYKDCEMTIADIITQLAYHEKATIKHKRYCNLCERWFPTTSRHRRHLAGYQHRYMELTQRKSIHALFILFTGKPCPRLLPANVIRSDCSIGELTPLQIAVQDVAKCVEYTQQNHKTKE